MSRAEKYAGPLALGLLLATPTAHAQEINQVGNKLLDCSNEGAEPLSIKYPLVEGKKEIDVASGAPEYVHLEMKGGFAEGSWRGEGKNGERAFLLVPKSTKEVPPEGVILNDSQKIVEENRIYDMEAKIKKGSTEITVKITCVNEDKKQK